MDTMQGLSLGCSSGVFDVPACSGSEQVLNCSSNPTVLDVIRQHVLDTAVIGPGGPLKSQDNFDTLILSPMQYFENPEEDCAAFLNELNVPVNRCTEVGPVYAMVSVVGNHDDMEKPDNTGRNASCTIQLRFLAKGRPQPSNEDEWDNVTVCTLDDAPQPQYVDGCGGDNVQIQCGDWEITRGTCQTNRRACTATDITMDCGMEQEYSVSFMQTVYVLNGPPSIVCPPNKTNLRVGSDLCPEATGFATATDACGNELPVTYSDRTVCKSCCTCEVCIHRTWSATDLCGNTTTCVQKLATVNRRYQKFLDRDGCDGCSNGSCGVSGGNCSSGNCS